MGPVLVTGGAGYIGAQTCKTLAQAGFLPVVYDNLSTGHAYAVKWGPLIEGDLSDQQKLSAAMKQFKPIAVLHFAASALVGESVENPGKYYRNNLVSSITLLEAMRDHGICPIVFSSTCATYGEVKSIPITEEHSQHPINPYGRSKLMVEQMISDFVASHGFCSAILRYFNVAGADLEGEIGENHSPETHLIPSIIEAALGMREEIVVYGTDFPSHDGTAIRDYVHVQDLANAHVAALQYLLTHKKNIKVNLGTGTGHSVFEIVSAVQQFCQKPLPIKIAAKRVGDPPILAADNQLAKRILNWTPKYSSVPFLIESAWKWHQTLLAKDLSC